VPRSGKMRGYEELGGFRAVARDPY
jgi:hypothetical protein